MGKSRNKRSRSTRSLASHVVAIANQKGGSGKTTTAVNLAAAFVELGKHVLLIDCDQQANATRWLGCNENESDLLEVFTDKRPLDEIIQTTDSGIDVVPSSTHLAGIDRAMANELGCEMILRKAIAKLPNKWDLILLDCPPALGLMTASALVASQRVLVPVEAKALGLEGLASLMMTIETVAERLNPDIQLDAILPCIVDRRTRLATEVIGALRKRLGRKVLKSEIGVNIRLAEAFSHRLPITSYASSSAGAADYRQAAMELAKRWR